MRSTRCQVSWIPTRYLCPFSSFQSLCLVSGPYYLLGFPSGSAVKNLPANADMWVPSLGQEDPLQDAMAIHSSILTRKFPWTEEPGGLTVHGVAKVGHDWSNWTHTYYLLLFGGSDKEFVYQWEDAKRCGFDPWVGKIPWKRKWRPIPVFLPGKLHEQRSLEGYPAWVAKSQTQLSTHTHITSCQLRDAFIF